LADQAVQLAAGLKEARKEVAPEGAHDIEALRDSSDAPRLLVYSHRRCGDVEIWESGWLT
jgi:hypothetical protein